MFAFVKITSHENFVQYGIVVLVEYSLQSTHTHPFAAPSCCIHGAWHMGILTFHHMSIQLQEMKKSMHTISISSQHINETFCLQTRDNIPDPMKIFSILG